jgi:chemotaxis signal transduction protein
LYETENDETFISLPVFFQKNEVSAPHGVVLKHSRRVVLLVPRIDVDLDISPQDIRALPECLRLSCFTGAAFVENDLILLLNTDRILGAALP